MSKYYACPICGCNSYVMRLKRQFCHECDKAVQKSLDDAVNRIAEYVDENLEDGWDIEIKFARGDCHMTLIDPEGEYYYPDTERDTSSIHEACECAKEIQEEVE